MRIRREALLAAGMAFVPIGYASASAVPVPAGGALYGQRQR